MVVKYVPWMRNAWRKGIRNRTVVKVRASAKGSAISHSAHWDPLPVFWHQVALCIESNIVSSQRVCLFIIMRKCRWHCQAHCWNTGRGGCVWVFGAMVFIEATLIMDCGIKMSLLTFKSPLETVGSFSLSVSNFRRCLQPSHVYTVFCWLERWRLKGFCCWNCWSTCCLIMSLVRIWLFSETWASSCDLLDFLFQILYKVCFFVIFVSNCGSDWPWRETTQEINVDFNDKNRFTVGFRLKVRSQCHPH